LEGLGGRIEIDHEVTQLPKSDAFSLTSLPDNFFALQVVAGHSW
jgi:hypothetical protein